eukprot:CAMPEP_0115138434 /NCGR_PEP_ID=MMETSP0227-20121206/57664_1 /TAXON_ID=89957 /ORGANISM="Polarella glacialis, Strain CCMP 1383" /LENGTH=53 /DNA_ID=CAMNT_0002546053 /DNA_START=339 /DNA_END=500 /DNA_ORIENTATION=-
MPPDTRPLTPRATGVVAPVNEGTSFAADEELVAVITFASFETCNWKPVELSGL